MITGGVAVGIGAAFNPAVGITDQGGQGIIEHIEGGLDADQSTVFVEQVGGDLTEGVGAGCGGGGAAAAIGTTAVTVGEAGAVPFGVGGCFQSSLAVVFHLGDGGDETIGGIARYNSEVIFAWTFQQYPSFHLIYRL